MIHPTILADQTFALPATPLSAVSELAERIEDALPQTQCTKCGFAACRPYAQAIAAGSAEINQCPPGGAEGVARLAALTGRAKIPISPINGIERTRPVAVIDEAICIGCTLCIQACPVDAIVGAAKQMHIVLPDLCTGCDLCVAPCPVDCIAMVPVTQETGWQAWSTQQADAARDRHDFRTARLQREQFENDARLAAKAARKLQELDAGDVGAAGAAGSAAAQAERERKRAIISAALERTRAQRAASAQDDQ